MRLRLLMALFAVVAAAAVGLGVSADEPIFVRWLVMEDPGDATIFDYWERAERGELDASALVDLGTMLFYRGYPKDAVRMFRRALDLDPDLYEAWFRIGLVEHREGNVPAAFDAYKRCQKKLKGHGWCNFYLALLEEKMGDTTAAVDHYRRAFKVAPELADPRVNPEVLVSDLALAAELLHFERNRFTDNLPMRYLQPGKVRRTMAQYEPAAEEEAAEEPPRAATTEPTGVETVEGTTETAPAPPPRAGRSSGGASTARRVPSSSEPAEQPQDRAPSPRSGTRVVPTSPHGSSRSGEETGPGGTVVIKPVSGEARFRAILDDPAAAAPA